VGAGGVGEGDPATPPVWVPLGGEGVLAVVLGEGDGGLGEGAGVGDVAGLGLGVPELGPPATPLHPHGPLTAARAEANAEAVACATAVATAWEAAVAVPPAHTGWYRACKVSMVMAVKLHQSEMNFRECKGAGPAAVRYMPVPSNVCSVICSA
jgi:hypothetical protein